MKLPIPQTKEWKTLETKECFSALPWVKVVSDKIELPSKRIVEGFYRVQLPDYAMICARDEKGRYLLIRQYKHALKKMSLGLTAGCIAPHEAPFEAAKRELLEETGFTSERWIPMGSFVTDGNRGCCRANFFLALDVKKVAEPNVDDMEELETVFMTQEEVMSAIQNHEIPVLAAVSLLTMASNPLYLKMIHEQAKVIKREA